MIDYSAENSFGGTVREELYISVKDRSALGYDGFELDTILAGNFYDTSEQKSQKKRYDEVAQGGTKTLENGEEIEYTELSQEQVEQYTKNGVFKFNVDTILSKVS